MNIHELRAEHPKEFEREYHKWLAHEPYYDWWEDTVEPFKENGPAKGFRVDDVTFAGYGSWGDSAAWTGLVHLPTYIGAMPDASTEPRWQIIKALVNEGWISSQVGVITSGRGAAPYSMSLVWPEVFIDSEDGEIRQGMFAGADVSELFDAIGGYQAVGQLMDRMLDDVRSYADDIYYALRDDYEHLTSEESFIEYCDCNEVEFDV